MKLVQEFDSLFNRLSPYFLQNRTFERAKAMAFGQLVTYGRHSISRIICTKDEQHKDWSADYKLFSRREWKPNLLFNEILKECDQHSHWAQNAIVTAMDDTAIKKTGKQIEPVRTLRDPMSPAYHVNLMKAIRFIQLSTIINPDTNLKLVRAIPTRFEEAAPAEKPGKNASDAIKEQYKKEKKVHNLSVRGHEVVVNFRKQIDKLPNGEQRLMFVAVDGSYCNRNFLRELPDNVIAIARTRKDIKIFRPAENKNPHGRKKVYGERLPTPEQIRQDDSYPWQTAIIFGAGKFHTVRFKTVAPILWQKGTGSMPMRLIVVAALRYRKKKNSKLLYREPAYLLCPLVDVPIEQILQYYFFRWDIEVNNRDDKSLLGVGEAQVRSEKSVESQPQFSVIAASLLLLASLRAYGPARTDDYVELPKWRKNEIRRPSMLDIIAQFRSEIMKEQLQIDLELKKILKQKSYKKHKKPRSRIEAQKRGFVNDLELNTTRLKLPVNILNALIFANC
jgi:hypothetical protein